MKKITLYFALLIFAIIAACSSSKKSTTSTAASTSAPKTATNSTTPSVFIKPTGINAPGDAELSAIQMRYKDCTLAQLKQGYEIYTAGACVNCHGAENIYNIATPQWKGIIDDMAQKARISDTEKDAVYKYVLAIKATQPK